MMETYWFDYEFQMEDGSSTRVKVCTGLGKIFLANMSDREFDEYTQRVKLKPRTTNTVINIKELKKQLKQIRRDGIAFEDEEHELGIKTISAPVRDWENNVAAAISVVGPSVRMTREKMLEIAPIVKNYASKISSAMGHKENLVNSP